MLLAAMHPAFIDGLAYGPACSCPQGLCIMTELVGWLSAIVLAFTISSQVYTQWRSKSSAGVSNWFFIGQMLASLGFVAYSSLLENWVFVWTNAFNFMAALLGHSIHRHNRRIQCQVTSSRQAD